MRGWGGAAPGYLLTNCMVRGELEYGCLVCSLLRGTPTRPHPTVSYAADRRGWMRPSPIQGLSTATIVNAFARHKDPSGTVCLFPPTGGTTPTRREGGVVPGCPRSKLHTRPS
ncbi:hypothetical protein C0Q96_22125 [Streptomyces albidoflavus]|nr:hypothetical protein C0Q96_22125 [Streptomyces albidoflavus]